MDCESAERQLYRHAHRGDHACFGCRTTSDRRSRDRRIQPSATLDRLRPRPFDPLYLQGMFNVL